MDTTSTLSRILTPALIRELADEKTYARATAYARDGAVREMHVVGNTLTGLVSGAHLYSVRLSVDPGGRFQYRCDCPVGSNSVYCKHAVALALNWLGEPVVTNQAASGGSNGCGPKKLSQEELIREYVASLDAPVLRDLLLEAAERDRLIRDKLLFGARAASSDDLPSLKAAVRQVTRIRRALDWREADGYGAGLLSLSEMLRGLLSGPQSSYVVELCELAVAGAEKSLEQIDDSSGGVMPGIQAIAAVHLDACVLMRPNAVKLAERLYRMQMESQWDTFFDVLPGYRVALGDAGLDRYRALVETAWESLPALLGSVRSERSFDARRMRLEHAMITLAELEGDVDGLIRIRSKDLSSPYRYLLVAEICAKYGRDGEGLMWAERGIHQAGEQVDSRLLDFCVSAYLRQGRFDEADALAWRRFESHPGADAFFALLETAVSTGRHQDVREKALDHLQTLASDPIRATKERRNGNYLSARTELVDIFLREEDDAAAWETFIGGEVHNRYWPRIAAMRGRTHRHDAIALYRRYLPIALEQGSAKARYDRAFEIVAAIAALRRVAGENAQFAVDLADIRAEYGAKRNFMKLLDGLIGF
jgi:hypothetical protein